MHYIESEIVKVTGYKVKRKFSDRQDYLKSLFNAANKMSDEDFDEISEPAFRWVNACVQAYNTSRNSDLPDFDEMGTSSKPVAAIDTDMDAEAPLPSEDDDLPPNQPEMDGHQDGGSLEDDSALATEELAEEALDEVKVVKKKRAHAKKAKAELPAIPPPVKKKPVYDPDPPELTEDAVLDKWGCIVGSKNSEALALFAKGATAREVKEAIGGTYYNVLAKMVQRGHRMEKEGSVINLIHRDDIPVSSRKTTK